MLNVSRITQWILNVSRITQWILNVYIIITQWILNISRITQWILNVSRFIHDCLMSLESHNEYLMSPESDNDYLLVVFSGSSGFLHQLNWPPRYSWNIVEIDMKHHQTNKQTNNHECILSVVIKCTLIDKRTSEIWSEAGGSQMSNWGARTRWLGG